MKSQSSKGIVLVVSPNGHSAVGRYAASVAGAVLVLAVTSAMSAQVFTGYTGGNQPHPNIQPSVAVNYIIALQGAFPDEHLTGGGGPSADIGALGADPFIGEVTMFAGTFAPPGWAVADGQLLSPSQNSALFSVIGTIYGGDGETTFALPDLRGRMPIGPGTGPGLSRRHLGQRGGFETAAMFFGEMVRHNHPLPSPVGPTGDSGGLVGHENMQPFLGLNPIIATRGLFPSSNLTQGGGGSINAFGSDPYLGGVTYFAGNFAPEGWALAHGQLLPISSNQALYSILGTTYGGDGETTFALPDLRGRTAIGPRTGPGLTERDLGERLGGERALLHDGHLPSHTHSLPQPSLITTRSTGNNQPHENMAPSLGLNYIIALQGTYPSDNLTDGGDGPISLAGSDPFIGEISLFAGNFAPRGWAFADGQLLPIFQNTALFSLLGTTYGGDGETTFGLPDLRGRAALGEGAGPGLSDWRLGERGGVEAVALSVDHLTFHNHELLDSPSEHGDFDGDWDIDGFDYATFTGQFGLRALPGVLASDLDNDGDVDLDDFRLFRLGFGFGVPAPPAAPVPAATPDPSTLCLLVLGGLGVLRRRRR